MNNMAKKGSFKFAVGNPDRPFSSVWRLAVNKHDIYIGASSYSMKFVKLSLHESGVWTLAVTKEYHDPTLSSNRRISAWKRPFEHADGVTRGPSIIIPHTSYGYRTLLPQERNVPAYWAKAPSIGEYVEYSLYFVKKGVKESWSTGESVVTEIPMGHGSKIVVLLGRKETPLPFLERCERHISESVVRAEAPACDAESSLLWTFESNDNLKIPIIIDLPAQIEWV